LRENNRTATQRRCVEKNNTNFGFGVWQAFHPLYRKQAIWRCRSQIKLEKQLAIEQACTKEAEEYKKLQSDFYSILTNTILLRKYFNSSTKRSKLKTNVPRI